MLARLDSFDAKSGRTRRKRYERRDDETRRCAAGRRFLFVAPFSVAHPCRQEKGIRLLFFFRPVLPLACSPLSVSAWFVLSPFPVASYSPCVVWGDTPRRVGGVIWLLVPRPVPSSRSATRSIFLISNCGRRRCAVFVSSFSCVIRWRQGGSFSLSSRLSSRLLVLWGVS